MKKIARGERNNNPGNLRHGSNWQGLSLLQTDKEFCQFISPEFGIRAIYKLLKTYQSKHGLNTVSMIINRYAPANENNTNSYIDRIEKEINIHKDKPVNTKSKLEMIPLVIAIVTVELGYQPYSKIVFENAWNLL
ncbi:structural protein [Proteus myxofaciens]|uniref:Structural protein n=1 Tax=Proteus myxofaciens ATCC 19692 TaxID=1354337 RepID=A0A198GGQ9_9GAMM|nr:structural protein [Proteus myxofaciens]OAT35994.1 structural protein [Proteus myxofaciens ATCC 19692]